MSKKKKWPAAAKFEIALIALKGDMTLNEICMHYAVAPSQIHAWKKQLLEQGAQMFGKANKSKAITTDTEQVQRQLYEKIGQLTVERDFLKSATGLISLFLAAIALLLDSTSICSKFWLARFVQRMRMFLLP